MHCFVVFVEILLPFLYICLFLVCLDVQLGVCENSVIPCIKSRILLPVGCSKAQHAKRDFVLGFLEHKSGAEGRIYVVNPSLTATVRVSVITPLLAEGTPGSVNGSLTLSPGTADYITVPNTAHMAGSNIENKGKVRLK